MKRRTPHITLKYDKFFHLYHVYIIQHPPQYIKTQTLKKSRCNERKKKHNSTADQCTTNKPHTLIHFLIKKRNFHPKTFLSWESFHFFLFLCVHCKFKIHPKKYEYSELIKIYCYCLQCILYKFYTRHRAAKIRIKQHQVALVNFLIFFFCVSFVQYSFIFNIFAYLKPHLTPLLPSTNMEIAT